MAKDIPVLSLKGGDIGNVAGDRLPETIFSTETGLLQSQSQI